MSGWYRLHRGWQDHAVFRDEPFSRRDAFVWLIEHAAYEGGKVRLPLGEIELQRGQLAHSLRFMAKAWKWEEPRVRRFITSLRNSEIIDAGTDAGQTVITIRNYAFYQASSRAPDAAAVAATTQPRRGNDAKKEEGKEREEKKARAGARDSGGGYAFQGEVVRLSVTDFTDWQATYHAIPDLRAELSSIDAWFAGNPAEDRTRWFHRAKRMLNTAHQRALTAQTTTGTAGGGNVASIDDAFMRRLERASKTGNLSRSTNGRGAGPS